jgi:late competence protein required for DNA uptake (superfamily II DNA/RNA helicase)
MSKANCQKCGSVFEIPKNTTSMIAGFYCKPCIKKAAQKYTSLSTSKVISITAKSIGL